MARSRRVRHRSGFTTVDNSAVRDKRLSTDARFLLVFMLSYPDNWEFSHEWLRDEIGWGRHKVDGATKLLKEWGYLSIVKVNRDTGAEWEWIWDDEPTVGLSDSGEPNVGLPNVGKPDVLDKEGSSKEGSKEETSTKRPKLDPLLSSKSIVDPWWEAKNPKPIVNYIGLCKIVQRCLDAGWDESLVRRALNEVPAYSANAFEFWRNNQGKSRGGVPERPPGIHPSAKFVNGKWRQPW